MLQLSPRSSSPRTFRDVLSGPPSVHKASPVDTTFFNAYLSDFSFFVQHSFTKKIRTEIHLAAKALLATFEPYFSATLRKFFWHIATVPASPELTAAAHSLVATFGWAHNGHGGYDAAWPVHAPLSSDAAAPSPRR